MVDTDSPDIQRLHQENALLRQYLSTLGDLALAGEIPLDRLLQQIVETARALLHARYAALGVFDARGRVKQFFTTGMSADGRAAIGPLPVGEGLLGLIVRENRILRVPRIAGHAASVGFPPGHPPMDSFLGGPIARGSTTYGNLYLTDRLGAAEFSPDDEMLLALLTKQAAVAIENAQRFARARQAERTTRALYDIGRSLAGLSTAEAMIAVIVRETRRLFDADVAGLCLRAAKDGLVKWVSIAGGALEPEDKGLIPLDGTIAGQVIETGVSFASNDLGELGDDLARNRVLVHEAIRSVVMTPLGRGSSNSGALMVGWRREGAVPDGALEVIDRLADRSAIELAQAELHAREQAALRKAEVERSSLEAIFDSMTDAVYTTDVAGRLVRLNRLALAWSGRSLAEAMGQFAETVFPLVGDAGQPIPSSVGQDTPVAETHLLAPDGELIPVERVISPIHDGNNQILGTVQVLRDLRPQREVEQLKANIISLVSHELRTPLSHIKGYASSLLQTDVEWDAETQHDFIASIERQADRLARLISDLLEISRLDAGGTARLERTLNAPAALVERGIRQAAPNAPRHPIDVTVAPDLPLVLADPSHVERVLSNLIENAAKYSADGAPISVSVRCVAGEVIFAVQDQGTGMTAEEQSHLFERFYRSPRVKHRTPGTGLGLAICREIVHAHGGRIWAESVEGEGSTFWFTLPCESEGGSP